MYIFSLFIIMYIYMYVYFSLTKGQCSKRQTILSVLAVHRPVYISICISTLPTQHTTFNVYTRLSYGELSYGRCLLKDNKGFQSFVSSGRLSHNFAPLSLKLFFKKLVFGFGCITLTLLPRERDREGERGGGERERGGRERGGRWGTNIQIPSDYQDMFLSNRL